MSAVTFISSIAPAASTQAPAYTNTAPIIPTLSSLHNPSGYSQVLGQGVAPTPAQDQSAQTVRPLKRGRKGVGDEYCGPNLQPRKKARTDEFDSQAVLGCCEEPEGLFVQHATKEETPQVNSIGLLTPPKSPPSPDSDLATTTKTNPNLDTPSDGVSHIEHSCEPSLPLCGPVVENALDQWPDITTLSCDHPRHPAYADRYNIPLCPMCLMVYTLRNLTGLVQAAILDKGGMRQWRESCRDPIKSLDEQQEEVKLHQMATQGSQKRQKKDCMTNEFGHDMSHRHSKKRLHNLLPHFQELMKIEQEWAKGKAATSTEDWYIYSARVAMKEYRSATSEGLLCGIEGIDMGYARRRGREHEIATDPDYPDDNDGDFYVQTYNQKSLAQALFAAKSWVPKITDYTSFDAWLEQLPPKRPRRDSNAKVSFASETEVCIMRDVDDIRKMQATKPKIIAHHKPSAAPGILRNAAPNNNIALHSNMDTKPRLPFSYSPITPEDRPYRPRPRYRRVDKKHYKPETCEHRASEGSVIVNTSGTALKSLDKWDLYVEMLHKEAEEMDDWEAAQEL
ncbi:hypothetical protein FB567DRAFT_603195 [Paraphoma chrysanthemicola]|uniref:Uncharacterized protein n=1 Tax=Paraphoma chrysanthemicola TaxID=798071 RepID=A0A8K0R3F6_9PLEO|nr:hypothetical protein FB567DRAFT_603195 [Paraphoma chrysanthemicola]